MKKIFSVFLVCLTLMACFPEKQAESDHIKVVIADRTFKIPKGYLDGRQAIGKDTESIVLEYSLPDFEVLPAHPQEREARQKLIDDGNMRSMLLENSSKRPSFDENVNLTLQVRSYGIGSLVNKNLYGLEKYSVQDWHDYKSTTPDDTFIERNNEGSVVSYLKCSPPNKDKIPGCRHRFRDKGVLYQIHWPIRELPNWKKQQNKAIAFIDSFEITETQIEEEE